MITLSLCDRRTISEDYMAVFFTVQFGSQSRGIYKPANQNSEKGLPGKHWKFNHDEISWFDIQRDAWTKCKVTNAVFGDAVGGFEAARLRLIQGIL